MNNMKSHKRNNLLLIYNFFTLPMEVMNNKEKSQWKRSWKISWNKFLKNWDS